MAKPVESGRDGAGSGVPHRSSALDAALARGLADGEAGRIKPAAEVFDRLEGKCGQLANRSA